MQHGSTEAAVRKARLIRGKGITYDTGFFHAGVSTRETFASSVLKREMRVIHDDLHCNAVRITGGNAHRLEIAANHAADASLEVWFSPFTCDLTTGDLLDFLLAAGPDELTRNRILAENPAKLYGWPTICWQRIS